MKPKHFKSKKEDRRGAGSLAPAPMTVRSTAGRTWLQRSASEAAKTHEDEVGAAKDSASSDASEAESPGTSRWDGDIGPGLRRDPSTWVPGVEAAVPSPHGASARAPISAGPDPLGADRRIDHQVAPRGAHVMKGEALTDTRRGVHVGEGDAFLSIERRARHARKMETFSVEDAHAATAIAAAPALGDTTDSAATHDEVTDTVVRTGPTPTTVDHTNAEKRRRRWPLIPVAGAAGALALGIGGGGAFAYFSSVGSGAGQAKDGSLATVSVVATTGPADLLPGVREPSTSPFTTAALPAPPSTWSRRGPRCTRATPLCAATTISASPRRCPTSSPRR